MGGFTATMEYTFKPGSIAHGLAIWERHVATTAPNFPGLRSMRFLVQDSRGLAIGDWDSHEDAKAYMATGVFTRLMVELGPLLAHPPSPSMWNLGVELKPRPEVPSKPQGLEAPARIPLIIQPLVMISERTAGTTLKPARVLTWHPLVALSTGLMEMAVEGAAKKLPKRLAALVRLRVSHRLRCPFCIGLNSRGQETLGIDQAMVQALAREQSLRGHPGIDEVEALALDYTDALTSQPLGPIETLLPQVKATFGPKNTLALAALVSKVNFWARLVQGLGLE